VTWEEVGRCWKRKAAGELEFLSDAVLRRVEKMGDLFAPALTMKQRLTG
jgi:bifunctional non-homologous end joining protein LigD